MRPRTLLATAIAALVLAGPAAAQSSAAAAPRALLIILPPDEARSFVSAKGAALALGVDPRSRRAIDFVAAVGDPDGGISRLRRTLAIDGITLAVGESPDAPPILRDAVERGFGGQATPVEEALRAPVSVVVLARATEAPSVAATTIVLGVGRRTPVLTALLGARGFLRAGDRPRPGVALAADVRATLLRAAGVRSSGAALHPAGGSADVASLDQLTRRFSRDEAGRYALSVALAATLYAPLAVGLLVRRTRASRFVRRMGQAVAVAPAGYLISLFLAGTPTSLRIIPVFAVAATGAIPRPSPRIARLVGMVLLMVAVVLAVGATVAPFRPTGEPALTLWGSPLELHRFWGLVNHLAALMLCGLVAGWSLARLPDSVLVGGGLVAAGVSGAAAVGANFVAPLWIIVAIWIAVVVRRTGRIRLRDVVGSAVVGGTAFAVALFASLAGPASHGSAAAERIFDHGWSATWSLVRAREELNIDQLTGRGIWFVVWTAVMVAGLVVALVSALRARPRPPSARHAFAGAVALAAAALATLVTEDTGVLVAPILGALAGAIWLQGDLPEVAAVSEGRSLSGSGPEGARGR